MNVIFVPLAGGSVDLLELAALADLAVLVSGQCLGDEVARVPRGHGMALGMVITDGRRADVLVMPVAGIERQSGWSPQGLALHRGQAWRHKKRQWKFGATWADSLW